MTIKVKLILSFLTIATIPILIIALLGIKNAETVIVKNQIAKLEAVADLKAEKIEAFFKEREADIKTAQGYFNIKTNLPIVSRLANDRRNPDYITAKKMLDEQLKALREAYSALYVDVMLVNPEGKIVYVANEVHAAIDLDHPLPGSVGKTFEELKKGICFSDIYVNDAAGVPFGMLVTAPVHDLQGRFIGVIAYELDMSSIYQFIQDRTGLGDTGETLIGKKIVGGALFLNPLRHDRGAALTRKVALGSEKALPIQRAILGENGVGQSVDYRGKEVIAAWRYILLLKWGMVAKIDIEEAFASVRHLENQIIIFGAILIISVTILAFLISRSIANPIQSLQEGMEVVGRGNLNYKVSTEKNDEIGRLSRGFDRMTENLSRIEAEREQMETELRTAQKLESIGQLAAGIAHEINSPMQFVGDNVHFLKTSFDDYCGLIKKYEEACGVLSKIPGQEKLLEEIKQAEEDADLSYLKENMPKSFDRTFEGIERVSTIILAMKDFSHPDQREKTRIDINKGLTNTLTVARNEYKYVAEVETEFGDLPPVICHGGEINQVFLNLIVNAAHAIEDVAKESQEKGKIHIRTEVEKEDTVLITIQDSGAGIPKEIRQRVFDPFFTTKEVGRGTGQGLAMARSTVVDKHGGSITLKSEFGGGTTFFVRLPIDDDTDTEAVAA